MTPFEIFSLLQKINYGFYDTLTDTIITPDNPLFSQENYFGEYMRCMSSEEVLYHQAGICWDVSLLSFDYLQRYSLPKKYIQDLSFFYAEVTDDRNSNMTTHSAVYYRDTRNNLWYWFEYSWTDYAGINGPFMNKSAMFDTIQHLLCLPARRRMTYFNERVNANTIIKHIQNGDVGASTFIELCKR